MKLNYGLKNVNQSDSKEFLTLVDKMLRDAYLKGYNHGKAGVVAHPCYWGLDEETGKFDNCMICGAEYK